MNGDQSDTFRPVVWYLAGIGTLSVVILGLLVVLFVTRVPEFTDAFVRNPPEAIQNDPLALVLVSGIVVSILLLLGLIVGFGAKYGLAEPAENHSDRPR